MNIDCNHRHIHHNTASNRVLAYWLEEEEDDDERVESNSMEIYFLESLREYGE